MITVRSVLSTTRPAAWHALAEALGFVRHPDTADADWTEFDGDGIVAVHTVPAGSADDGRVDLQVLVDDLPTARSALSDAGLAVTTTALADVGELLHVTAGTGAGVTLTSADRHPSGGATSVVPMQYAEVVADVAPVLRAVGLRPRVTSDSGGWADFTADGGGLAALHQGPGSGTVLSFEHRGDLDALAERVRAAGYTASVVDEAYNRTLLVGTPDGWQLWVNGAYDDLYGYTRQG